MKLERWLLRVWYGDRSSGWWLAPLGWLMQGVTALRRWLYRHGLPGQTTVSVPVIVIGNITAGGTGKTPLVIWLVNRLIQSGWRVGVLTRGYGSRRGRRGPLPVSADTNPVLSGDEAVVIARQTAATVVAGPQRIAGARQLEAQGVQVIVCDDGLQHYRLDRNVEIAVVDGARGLGNGRFVPAGPLREAPHRLQTVTAVVVNGRSEPGRWPGAYTMEVSGAQMVALADGQVRSLAVFAAKPVHAVAGIGNPERFFELLHSHQIAFRPHVFPDHAAYRAEDFVFDDDLPILMTEKDAVKCAAFATAQMWFVPVQAQFASQDADALCDLISAATGLNID